MAASTTARRTKTAPKAAPKAKTKKAPLPLTPAQSALVLRAVQASLSRATENRISCICKRPVNPAEVKFYEDIEAEYTELLEVLAPAKALTFIQAEEENEEEEDED